MSLPSPSAVCMTAAVVVLSLALTGCPKRPEIVQAGPGAVGPAPAVVAPAAPAPVQPPVAEVPVARPMPPAVTPVEPPPTTPPTPAPAPSVAPPTVTLPPAPPPPVAETKATAPAPALVDVFFDFDKATIRQDQQTALQELIAELKQHTGMKLTVEGHCDERGASEYNLALGERRAKTVKAALLKAGVAADRIATVSYGEERPFVRGKDESAWKWNRRAHFVLSGQ